MASLFVCQSPPGRSSPSPASAIIDGRLASTPPRANSWSTLPGEWRLLSWSSAERGGGSAKLARWFPPEGGGGAGIGVGWLSSEDGGPGPGYIKHRSVVQQGPTIQQPIGRVMPANLATLTLLQTLVTTRERQSAQPTHLMLAAWWWPAQKVDVQQPNGLNTVQVVSYMFSYPVCREACDAARTDWLVAVYRSF